MPICTNVGTAYDTTVVSKELGLALVDFTGATQLTFTVFVNKVGTGTQSWQLWNVTNGSEIVRIDDTGPAGDKTILASAAVALTGLKTIRVRVKSTVGTDDPVFYGWSFFLTRP